MVRSKKKKISEFVHDKTNIKQPIVCGDRGACLGSKYGGWQGKSGWLYLAVPQELRQSDNWKLSQR